jgi:hypothetical protein
MTKNSVIILKSYDSVQECALTNHYLNDSPPFPMGSCLWCNIGISPLWTQLNVHKTLINDQQHECYSFLALEDNFTSRDLISNNETYTSAL